MARRITKATAKKVARFALEKKAFDVRLMDLRKITTVTDFFIICSGASSLQVKAIVDNILEKCRKDGLAVHSVEGYEAQRWVLIDMIEIVVHVFLPDVRAYYQLERLWGDAPTDVLDEPEEAA